MCRNIVGAALRGRPSSLSLNSRNMSRPDLGWPRSATPTMRRGIFNQISATNVGRRVSSLLSGDNLGSGGRSMSTKIWMSCVICLAVIAVVASSSVTAQNVLTGDWTASLEKDSAKIHLNFERRTEKGKRNQMGQTY